MLELAQRHYVHRHVWLLQRDGTEYYTGDLLTYTLASMNTTLLTSINAQRDNGGNSAKAGMLLSGNSDAYSNGGHTVIYMQSKPGSSKSVSRQYQNGELIINENAEMQAQCQLFTTAGQTQFYYYVQNPLSSAGDGSLNTPHFESVVLQEVLQFY